MKQAKTLAKRNNAHIGLCIVLCVLLLTVTSLLLGTSLGTPMSAKADTAEPSFSGVHKTAWDNAEDITGQFTLRLLNSDKEQLGVFYPVARKLVVTDDSYTSINFRSGFTYLIIRMRSTNKNNANAEYTSYLTDTNYVVTNVATIGYTFANAKEGTDLVIYNYLSFNTSLATVPTTAAVTVYVDPIVVQPLPDDPEKEGHTFAGWYYGTEEEHGDSCVKYNGSTITEDTNLHAHWTVNTYTVTYDTDSGASVDGATVEWNTAAPMPELTRTGYNFVGWFNSDGTQYNGEGVTEDMTLTAYWEIKVYTVTFYVGGEVYTSIEVPHGTALRKVMSEAKVANYMPLDSEGVRVSLQSTITEDTNVLIHELSGWEKYGNFVARNHWLTWVVIGVIVALLPFAVFGIVELVKKVK